MVSKIIQKEKERQEELIKTRILWENDFTEDGKRMTKKEKRQKNPEYGFINFAQKDQHKQSLISLKEYLEEEVMGNYRNLNELIDDAYDHKGYGSEYIKNLEEDIKELNDMIRRYA